MIQISVSKHLAHLERIPIDRLTYFQDDLKSLSTANYNRLRKSLLENGIIVPVFIWENNGKLLIIDGHQRFRVMQKEKWKIDLPVVRIDASDIQDAKKKLLVISSQYGTVDQESFDTFTFDLDADWLSETVHFDALSFEFSNGDMPEDWKEYDENAADDVQYCECPECGHKFPK